MDLRKFVGHGEMSMQFGSFSRQLGHGSTVDLDEKVGGKIPAVTERRDDKDVVVSPERDRVVRDLIRNPELFVPVEPPAAEKSKK